MISQADNAEAYSIHVEELATISRETAGTITKLDITNFGHRRKNATSLMHNLNKFTSLVSLSISSCDLTLIPDVVYLMLGLETLALEDNLIDEIPTKISQLVNLRVLEMGNNAFTSFPVAVTELEGLLELDLSFCNISEVPSEISKLTSLRELRLHDCELREFPSTLLELPNITHLLLGENTISEIPDQISGLVHLSELYLHENKLQSLPDSLSTLQLNILTVDFADQVESLPAVISGLHTLSRISISGAGLTSLDLDPSSFPLLEIFQCDCPQLSEFPRWLPGMLGIKLLYIRGGKFASIPVEIQQLRFLTDLKISDTNVSEIPIELFRLSRLTSLDLSNNQIMHLPLEIENLVNLELLSLDGNNLDSLPPQIGSMPNLSNLQLSDNGLIHLPRELGNLRSDVHVALDGNPLVDPLPDLLERGFEHVREFLSSLGDALAQYEAKILLVGEGNVGKSSLVDALLGARFIENRPTTHGIELGQLSLAHPEEEVELHLRTWDFGGQEVYRVTHQFFFSARALYVLVWRPREGQEENSVDGWCTRIRLRVGSSARVMIVATHGDERRAELDYPSLKAKFGDMLLGHWTVDNLSLRGIDELRQAIALNAARLPQMGSVLPRRWTAVRSALQDLLEPAIPRQEFVRRCEESGFESKSEIDTFANLLHDLGQAVYFPYDIGVRDILVLQPEWLTKAIGYILEDHFIRENAGIVPHARLQDIWTTGEANYDERFHPYFLRLMEKFDVSYRIPDEERSLVCQLVPFERPTLPWEPHDAVPIGIRQLSAVCQLSDEAPGMIAWLTARNHRFTTNVHWRRGMYFRFNEYESDAIIELAVSRSVRIDVRAPSPDYFFSILRDSLEYLIRQRWKGLSFEIFVPCPGFVDRDGRPCSEHFKLRHLVQYRERGRTTIDCHECVTSHEVAELLTGFSSSGTPLQELLEEVRNSTDRVEASIQDGFNRTIAASAEQAYGMRLALKLLSQEVDDCPRLVTISEVPQSRISKLRKWRDQYSVCLWCEEPGSEHPLPEQYTVNVTKERLRKILPYASVVLRILNVALPGASLGAPILMDESQVSKTIRDEISAMKSMVSSISLENLEKETVALTDEGLTYAEGAALRALRSLLLELDPSRQFSGLRRVVTASGDYAWVCSIHYRRYDPGLPQLPYAGNVKAID